MRDHISFGFGTTISIDGKTLSVPQFIGAPKHNFETADLGIESSVPLALDGWVNPSDTLFLATKSLQCSQPPIPESLLGAVSAF